MLIRSWLSTLRSNRRTGQRRPLRSFGITAAELLEDRTLLAGTVLTATGGFQADTRISAAAQTTNYGTSTALQTDGSPDIATLFRIDLQSVVPRNSTVQSVSITLNVTATSNDTYEIYQLMKPFSETQATYFQAANGSNWVGANGPTDRGTTVLGTVTPNSMGTLTIQLNAAGVAVVQSWVNNPALNYGFIMLDYANSVGLAEFSSREDPTAANRPSFSVTFTNEAPTAVNDFYTVAQGGRINADNKDIDGVLINDTDPENGPLTAQLVSGPSHGTLSLQSNGKFVYNHNGDTATSDSFTYIASDGVNSSNVATVFITIQQSGPTNQPPVVYAGSNASTTVGQTLQLDGTVTDDGLPNPPGVLTTTWNVLSGPGTVTFGNPNVVDTTAVFSAAGTYSLRLVANDGQLTSYDTVTITVAPAPANQPPVVDAGVDRAIFIGQSVTLDGTVSDDGLPIPPGSVSTRWTKLSGPGTVTFGNEFAVDTTATFSAAGTYVLQLSGYDGLLASFDTMTVTVYDPNANLPPSVDAGPNRVISLGQSASLDGTVFDDGLGNPIGYLSTAWTKVSGPGTVTFANASAVDTTATFSTTGTYTLRLTASDGLSSSNDTMTVTVSSPVNQSPNVDAGPNRTITLGQSASLDGTVSDDGLPNPPGALSVVWTKESGPGTVTFGSATSVDTTATFSVAGTYVLKLTASDGALASSDTMTVTVNSVVTNQAPSVDAGPSRSITLGQSAFLDGTVSDDGLPNPPGAVTTTWTKSSGPGTVQFANANAIDTTATFSVPGTYVLRLTASDGSLSSWDTMTVFVSSPTTNQAPTVDAGPNLVVLISSPAFLDGTVTDDGLPNPPGAVTYSWTKVSGPGTVTFANAQAVDTTALFSQVGSYVLRLTASDGSLSSSDTVSVSVTDTAVLPSGIWISAAELANLPTSGPAWNYLVNAASGNIGTPNLSDQNDSTNTKTLAKALVGVRTGNETYKAQVRTAVMSIMETENGGETLALGRNLAAFVIAADLVGLSPAQDAQFRAWLGQVIYENLRGRNLVSTFEDRPNNWGTMAGGSLAAVAMYLGDQTLLARVAQVFKGWVGDRSSYAGFSFGDLSWQADPNNPVAINPLGAMKDGHSIDGALPDEMRRGGSFRWPPRPTGYPWEALQGAIVQAEILYRAGYTDVYQWEDRALLRAVQFLYDIGWDATGDDEWIVWVIDSRYGTNFADNPQASAGKIMGWTGWTHQFASQTLRLAASDPPPAGPVSVLTADQLQPFVDEAISRIGSDGEAAALLQSVQFQIVDLPGTLLGKAEGNTVYIDQDAAGYGWFLDATLSDDEEFDATGNPLELLAPDGSLAAAQADLLSVILHEFGHVLGYHHSHDHDAMSNNLATGMRRLWDADASAEHDSDWHASKNPEALESLDQFFCRAAFHKHDQFDELDSLADKQREGEGWWHPSAASGDAGTGKRGGNARVD